MRILRFIIDNESIKQDPSCDFSGLFPGKNPDVRAEFIFSSEWENSVQVAAFWSMLDTEYEPQVVRDGKCNIPKDALNRASFKVQLLGKKYEPALGTMTLSTNRLTIRQTGGRR